MADRSALQVFDSNSSNMFKQQPKRRHRSRKNASAHIRFATNYPTEMLRAGVSFAAIIKLLCHKSPHMTLEYLEITQQDLQREFHIALSHPRHLAPSHTTLSGASPRPDLSSLIVSLNGRPARSGNVPP
jgi:hypothetical protein